MHQTVYQGDHTGCIRKDFIPFTEGSVGSDDGCVLLISPVDDFKQHVKSVRQSLWWVWFSAFTLTMNDLTQFDSYLSYERLLIVIPYWFFFPLIRETCMAHINESIIFNQKF